MSTLMRSIKNFKIKSLLNWLVDNDEDNLPNIIESNKLYELNGQLKFSILFNPRKSILTLKIIQAMDLITSNNNCNPCVVVQLVIDGRQPVVRKTQTKRSNNNPIFTETFVFKVSREDIFAAKLNILVNNEFENGKCSPIGKIELDCQRLEYHIELSEWFLLLQSLELI